MATYDFDLPHPVLTKIGDTNTKTTFATILVTQILLNANAALIYSTRGDGVHGHLALTTNADDYKHRSIGGAAFQVPIASPAFPAFPAHEDKATDAEIAEDNRQHKVLLAEFVPWHNADAILRNLLIAAVPTIFIAAICNPVTGFRNVSCLSILNHLHDIYRNITEKEL
jgi:hypothetical protein